MVFQTVTQQFESIVFFDQETQKVIHAGHSSIKTDLQGTVQSINCQPKGA